MEKVCISHIYGTLLNLAAYQGKSLLIPC